MKIITFSFAVIFTFCSISCDSSYVDGKKSSKLIVDESLSPEVADKQFKTKISDFETSVHNNGNYQLLYSANGRVYYCKSGLSISYKYNKPFLLPIIVWDARDDSKRKLNIPGTISGHSINANMIVDKLDFEGRLILIVSSENGEDLERLKIVSFDPSNESFAYVRGNGDWSFGEDGGVDYVAYSTKVRKELFQGEFIEEKETHRITISQLLDQQIASDDKKLDLDDNSANIENVIDKTDNHHMIEEMLPKLRGNYLTKSDLSRYSQEQLMLMRNAIFAVHGYRFNREYLQNFFSKFDWYSPQHDDVSSQLSEIERQNIDTILSIE